MADYYCPAVIHRCLTKTVGDQRGDMDTLREMLGVLEQFEGTDADRTTTTVGPSGKRQRVVTDGGTFAHRRKVEHLDHLLARGERDGTFDRMFSPGYPPVRISVADEDDQGAVVVDDPDATVSVEGRRVRVLTHGRERTIDLSFRPQTVTERRVGGRTAVGLE